MPTAAPPPVRQHFRFLLPPSLGAVQARARVEPLEQFLAKLLGREVKVGIATDYDGLAKELLSGRVDAAWAPPFACARVEAMGVRILARAVRHGASSYRAALVCRADAGLSLDALEGKKAVWVDRDSVGGYLLAVAFLKSRGKDPGKLFFSQHFAGSYKLALDALLKKEADLTSIFAPPGPADAGPTGMMEIAPDRAKDIAVLAYTEPSPNDGVALSVNLASDVTELLEKALLGLHESSEGVTLLNDLFRAERFEAAERLSYRALYRVALASL